MTKRTVEAKENHTYTILLKDYQDNMCSCALKFSKTFRMHFSLNNVTTIGSNKLCQSYGEQCKQYKNYSKFIIIIIKISHVSPQQQLYPQNYKDFRL